MATQQKVSAACVTAGANMQMGLCRIENMPADCSRTSPCLTELETCNTKGAPFVENNTVQRDEAADIFILYKQSTSSGPTATKTTSESTLPSSCHFQELLVPPLLACTSPRAGSRTTQRQNGSHAVALLPLAAVPRQPLCRCMKRQLVNLHADAASQETLQSRSMYGML